MADVVAPLNAALRDRYAIERELGEGGMAVVYLAEDLRHHRKVALKVLRPEFAAVVGGQRFLREIETTAHLQHPHILPLFDSGEADSFLFYVMPYVEGESLRDRIDRERQLPVEEAVRIARDLAEALDYAHRQGVIHRDIKPANILMHEGRPLIADFGIALAAGAAGGARLTETGLSVGTPYYMSPEQATGDGVVGPPSDIYALACVLYESLVGEPPYTGRTAQALLWRILQGAPVSAKGRRATVPANVDAAIRRALEKLPADRFGSAKDFGAALGDRTFRHGEVADGRPAATRWKRATMVGWTAAAFSLTALAWALLRPVPPPVVSRYGLAFAPGQAPLEDLISMLTLAPDGSFIVYVGPGSDPNAHVSQLWIKRRDEFEAKPLAGTDSALVSAVSPDGKWIAFQVGAQLRKVPVTGGAATALADSVNPSAPSPVAWLDDGTIAYVDTSWRLRRLAATGGTADSIWASTSRDLPYIFGEHALPDSRGMLFTICNNDCTWGLESWVLDLRTGKAHAVAKGAIAAWYAPTGHLVYVRPDGSVFAAPFDLKSLKTRGSPVPVLKGVKVYQGIVRLVSAFTLGPDGTLFMTTGATAVRSAQLVWVTRDGRVTPVDSSWTFNPGNDVGWALSPDGTRIALDIGTSAGHDIYVKQLPGGPMSRLTFDAKEDRKPRWSPDGTRVVFLSNRRGNLDVWSRAADGTGDPELLYGDQTTVIAEAFWSPDNKWLVMRVGGQHNVVGGRNILALRRGVDTVPRPIVATQSDEEAPDVSPDSHWIAYEARETGRRQVFVRPFPDAGSGRWQVSTDGGGTPLWAHNGHELFYIDAKHDVVAVQVDARNGFHIENREVLFHLGDEYFIPIIQSGEYAVTADDQRFLFGRHTGPSADRTRTIVVEHWTQELKAKMGG